MGGEKRIEIFINVGILKNIQGGIMKYSQTFTNSNSQTVSIPAEYKFADNVKEVQVERKGDCIILKAVQPSYENLMKVVNNFSDDFMNERIQPKAEERDLF